MHTEGFEDLEEEQTPRRAYVSNVSQDDADRLLRENERLKKSLEKEKFFNKLLDQEIQELKGGKGATQDPQYSSYWYGSRGVSKGMFYTLLAITLAMGAYIGYGIYYDKQFDYLKELNSGTAKTNTEAGNNFSTPVAPPPASENTTTENKTTSKEQTPIEAEDETPPASVSKLPAATETTPLRDSVPNIIAKKTVPVREKTVAESEPATTTNTNKEVDIESAAPGATAEPVDTRPIIARYRVTSKANFYNTPDENSLRGTFISQGNDKIVGALEDKNGFIFVVYTNDLGYTSRGWLSKKDLTKVD